MLMQTSLFVKTQTIESTNFKNIRKQIKNKKHIPGPAPGAEDTAQKNIYQKKPSSCNRN